MKRNWTEESGNSGKKNQKEKVESIIKLGIAYKSAIEDCKRF